MTIADITLTLFTFCNSARFLAYIPQIARAARDQSGAEAISLGTWALFLVSHASGVAYALVNNGRLDHGAMFMGNAAGCIAVLAIAVCKRARARRWKRRPRDALATGRKLNVSTPQCVIEALIATALTELAPAAKSVLPQRGKQQSLEQPQPMRCA